MYQFSRHFIGLKLQQKYEIKREIGKGGRGIVFEAYDHDLQSSVAIKVIAPNTISPEEPEAFRKEGQILANLSRQSGHHILPVFSLETEVIDEIPTLYLVMQFASKGTLADRLESKEPLPIETVAHILRQAGDALSHAHKNNVIHLDFKPANILFDDEDNVLVADFGLAKLLDNATGTKGSTGAGTLHYMAPEQKHGFEVGVFSDVYACGITLHQMLTGRVPKETQDKHTGAVQLKLDERRLSPEMRKIIKRATAFNPRQRYLSINELLQDFSSAIRPSKMVREEKADYSQQRLISSEVPSPGLPQFPLTSEQNAEAIRDAMHELGRFCEEYPDINEREVVTRSFMKLFPALGYVNPGEDVYLELQQADVVLKGFDRRNIAVIEFKRPNRSPEEGFAQLNERYVPTLEPNVGVLCNGRKLWVYTRVGKSLVYPPYQVNLKDATVEDAERVNYWLGRRHLDLTNLSDFEKAVREIAQSAMPVRGSTEPGGQEFLKQFTLRKATSFADLVVAMHRALPTMLEVSNFTKGAYTFWRRIYAREQKKDTIPAVWKSLLSRSSQGRESTTSSENGKDREEVYQLMFAIESSYAVLSRLLLARAMENHEFPDLDLIDALLSSLKHLRVGRKLPSVKYAQGFRNLFSYLGNMAFQSLFGSDIFDWWYDISKYDDPDTAEIGIQLAKCAIAIFRFDFKPMSGDLLGELYQAYFDAETRKALGEFYTPPEVVDFILDELGYTPDNPNLPETRLLDPSCGSGTFIVHALQRYLAAMRGKPPKEVLNKLLGGLKIVGFDVNPFAVLMAQANYAAQIIPICAQMDDFLPTLSIPILRTDSLRQEYREGEMVEILPGQTIQQTFGWSVSQEDEVTIIKTELPIIGDEQGQFLTTTIPVPRFDKARERMWVNNPEEYFVVLHVLFDAVAKGSTSETVLSDLLKNAGLRYHLELARYIREAVRQLVDDVRRLKEEYDDDGRFLKTLADLAQAIVLKSDIRYDYVVGNPPYIRIQAIPEMLRKWWEQWYTWANQNFDAFIPFLERGVYLTPSTRADLPSQYAWLQPGGRLGFICSGRFLQLNYAEALRTLLPQKAAIELILDFRDSPVFKDATNYPAIITMRRLEEGEIVSTEKFPVIRVFDGRRQNAGQLLKEALALKAGLYQGQEYIQGRYMDAFLTSHSKLHNSLWRLMPSDEEKVFHKLVQAATVHRIEECPLCKDTHRIFDRENERQRDHAHTIRLEQVTTTSSGGFQGIATGHDPSLVFRCLQDRGDTLLVSPKGAADPDWAGPKEVEIEKAALRPWLFGRDVQRWSIHWDQWYVFFPYDLITAIEKRGQVEVPVTRLRLIPTSDACDIFKKKDKYVGDFPLLDERYPKIWKDYLTDPVIEKNLRSREKGRYKKSAPDGYKWHELSRGQNLECFEQDKLVLQMNSNIPKVAIEDEENKRHYVFQAGGRGGGVYGILHNTQLINDTFLAGVLNSPILDFYLKHISAVFGGNYYSYSDSFIKELPIKLPLTEAEHIQAQRIEEIAKKLIQQARGLYSKEEERDSFPRQQSLRLSSRHNLYPLEDFVVGKLQAQRFKREKGPTPSRKNLHNEIEIKCGKGWLTLKLPFLADVVTMWLRLQPSEEISLADLLALHIPNNPEGCRLLVEALTKLESEIDQTKQTMDLYEQELTSLVVDYYGLDACDNEVVENFLKLF
jgi:serine/threonine protein kinase